MLDKLSVNIFNTKNKYYVIGISSKIKSLKYNLVTLEFKNENLKIYNFVSFETFEDCLKNLIKDYPIILHIESENVLNKVTEKKENYKRELIFNANIDDFYFYEFSENNKIFTSIIRKNKIDKYILEIKKVNRFVVHSTFGPFVLANLIPFTTEYKVLSSENYSIIIEEGKLISFVKKEENSRLEYEINGDIITKEELPLFASFLDLKSSNDKVENEVSFLLKNKSEYQFKSWEKKIGATLLITIIILLLVSHNLHTYYQGRLAEKNIEYQLSQKIINEFKFLKKEKVLKEAILQKSGIINVNFITKYIKDIGNSISKDVILKSINVFPPKNKIREDEEIEFYSNVIIVKGEALNDNSFNRWTIELKNLSWLKKMNIIEYNRDSKNSKMFILKIII
jgi:hypothetical protein